MMRRLCILYLVLAAALIVLPKRAAAQYSDCWFSACSSFVDYDASTNVVFGYSRSMSDLTYFIRADSFLYTSGSPVMSTSSGWGFYMAVAEVFYVPGGGGDYIIHGDHYCGDNYVYYLEGFSSSEYAYVPSPPPPEPYGEMLISAEATYDADLTGATFHLKLLPESDMWSGGRVVEWLTDFDDACFRENGGTTLAQPNTYIGDLTGDGRYADFIGVATNWLAYNRARTSNGCSFDGGQQMDFWGSGGTYASHGLGVIVHSSNFEVYRASSVVLGAY